MIAMYINFYPLYNVENGWKTKNQEFIWGYFLNVLDSAECLLELGLNRKTLKWNLDESPGPFTLILDYTPLECQDYWINCI